MQTRTRPLRSLLPGLVGACVLAWVIVALVDRVDRGWLSAPDHNFLLHLLSLVTLMAMCGLVVQRLLDRHDQMVTRHDQLVARLDGLDETLAELLDLVKKLQTDQEAATVAAYAHLAIETNPRRNAPPSRVTALQPRQRS